LKISTIIIIISLPIELSIAISTVKIPTSYTWTIPLQMLPVAIKTRDVIISPLRLV
jgi:hypothetical protein